MEVVHPSTTGGVHAPGNIFERYRCAFSQGQLRYAAFDFRKRFRCPTYMRIAFARFPTLADPDCKTQEIEALFPGINNKMGSSLALWKTAEHEGDKARNDQRYR